MVTNASKSFLCHRGIFSDILHCWIMFLGSPSHSLESVISGTNVLMDDLMIFFLAQSGQTLAVERAFHIFMLPERGWGFSHTLGRGGRKERFLVGCNQQPHHSIFEENCISLSFKSFKNKKLPQTVKVPATEMQIFPPSLSVLHYC